MRKNNKKVVVKVKDNEDSKCTTEFSNTEVICNLTKALNRMMEAEN